MFKVGLSSPYLGRKPDPTRPGRQDPFLILPRASLAVATPDRVRMLREELDQFEASRTTLREMRPTKLPTTERPRTAFPLFTTTPHGQQEVILLEDQVRSDDRIYELRDRPGLGRGRISLLGSEFASLCRFVELERRRRGREALLLGEPGAS